MRVAANIPMNKFVASLKCRLSLFFKTRQHLSLFFNTRTQ